MSAHRSVLAGVLLISTGGLFAAGCHGSGGGGTQVIVTGGGGNGTGTTQSQSTTTTPGAFSLVVSDPGGGTVVESADKSTRKIAGVFNQDFTMEAKYAWVLDAPVFFGSDDGTLTPTLTIEAGTQVQGRGGTPPSMLVIRRGARIMANGTAAAPIVFTSSQPVGSRAPGDWGGIIINGRAPVNSIGPAGELPFGEGGSGRYGGADPSDNSGTLRYVRVEFAGHVFTSDDELNGIAFQGVGSGTTVDFVQVHKNADDGVEFFGGTVNAKHLLLTGCIDDSLDWTSGWVGKVQYVAIVQWDGGSDNGIEADNLELNHSALPRSAPVISNMTMVGPAGTGAQGKTGLRLRRGTGFEIYNSIVVGLNEFALDIDDVSTWNVAYSDAPASYTTLSGACVLQNTFVFDSGVRPFADDAADPNTDTTFFGQHTPANQQVDPNLRSLVQTAPDLRPNTGSPVLATFANPGDPFFDGAVGYAGAMDATTDWTSGWSSHPAN